MNLPDTWQGIANSPIIIALAALTGATILVVFLAPLFFNLLKQIKFPKRLKFIKRYPRRSLAAIFAILILAFIAYLFCYFNQPVRIITAAQFKLEKGKAIERLQKSGFTGWEQAQLYLLDIRTSQEYTANHLKGSASSPAAIAAIEVYPMKKVAIAVFSSKSGFKEARELAEAIKKNGKMIKDKSDQKVGTIYVIKDGFEGLKAAGLATESGVWD